MRILVLGGTSFFGREFVRQAAPGHEVTVFSRRCPSPGLPPGAQQVPGNRGSRADLKRLAGRDWDLVVDNVCFGPAQARLAARLFAGRAGRWVFTSTASVYYAFRAHERPEFAEDWAGSSGSGPLRPKREFPYGVRKWLAEEEFREAFRRHGFPVAILRLPMVVGAGDPKARAQAYLWRLRDGGPLIMPDGGAARWRFLFYKDAARAFWSCARAPKAAGETFNVGDVSAIRVRDWVGLCAEALGVKADLAEVPGPWLDRHGFDFATAPFASDADFALDVSKARRLLSWDSTPIADWTRETAEAFLREPGGPAPNRAAREAELDLARRWRASAAAAAGPGL